jgi:hypothetical protein
MASNVSIVVKTSGAAAATKELKDIGDEGERTGNRLQQMNRHLASISFRQLGQDIASAGKSFQGFAESQQDMNVTVGQTAAAMHISEEAFRSMAKEISNAGLPLKDTTELMKLANQEGLSGDGLKNYVGFWDDVGDATGRNAIALAEAATGLRAVGIAAGDEAESLNALGFITDHTKMGVDDFLGLLQKKGAALHDFGINIDDTAAVLGVMEKSLGLTGKAAASEFASALEKSDGSLTSLLSNLGITREQFDAMRQSVQDSSDVIARNAAIQDDTITSMERWKQQLDELLFSHADLVRGLSEFAPLVVAGGTAIQGLGNAMALMNVSAGDAVGILGNVGKAAFGVEAGMLAAGLAIRALGTSTVTHLEALHEWERLIGTSTSSADKQTAALNLLGQATAKYNDINDGAKGKLLGLSDGIIDVAHAMTGGLVPISESDKAYQRLKEKIELAAKELVGAGAATDQLKAIQATLPPQLQSIFEAAVRAAGGFKDMGGAAGGLGRDLQGLASQAWAAEQAILAAAMASAAAMRQMKANAAEFYLPTDISQIPYEDQVAATSANASRPQYFPSSGGYSYGGGGGGGGGGSAAADAAKETVESFLDAMAQELVKTDMSKAFGDAGERVLVAFGEALADPKKQASIAPAVARLIEDAEKAGVPNATALGADLIAAINEGLATGDWDGVYAKMHGLADSLGDVGVASKKAADAIGDDMDKLAKLISDTGDAFDDAAVKEAKALSALATSHADAMQRIKDSLADARRDAQEAADERRAQYAEDKALRAADAADAAQARRENAAEAKADRLADSNERLEQLASDHADKIAEIEEKQKSGVTTAEWKKLEAQKKSEDKRYASAVAAEAKRLAKADADAEKALKKQDEAAAKSLAKQEAAAARAQAKADEAAAKALAKKEEAAKTAAATEDARYAAAVKAQEQRYKEELDALKKSYADKEKAAREHMAAMMAIMGTAGGGMLPTTIDWSVPADPNSPSMRWDSANQRWVDTNHMPLPGYATGTDFVPNDGPAYLHRGEAVIPASENKGGSGGEIHIHITGDNYFSDGSDLDRFGRGVGHAVRTALMARGKS